MSSAATSAHIVGEETIEGVPTTHVSFLFDISRYEPMPIKLGLAHADVWIDKSTNLLRQQTLSIGGFVVPLPTTLYSKINEPVVPPIVKP